MAHTISDALRVDSGHQKNARKAEFMMHIGNAAAALGGEVTGHNTILCPGPGHSPKDRSLSVKLDPTAPGGFLTYSHTGDDWRLCRDHVRACLGLPPCQPGD